jgi:hypothetical protein
MMLTPCTVTRPVRSLGCMVARTCSYCTELHVDCAESVGCKLHRDSCTCHHFALSPPNRNRCMALLPQSPLHGTIKACSTLLQNLCMRVWVGDNNATFAPLRVHAAQTCRASCSSLWASLATASAFAQIAASLSRLQANSVSRLHDRGADQGPY